MAERRRQTAADAVPANTSASLTVTVQGAMVGNTIDLGLPSNIPAGVLYQAYVSAANTVTVQAFNVTAGAVDPASGVFKVTVT